MAENSGFEWTHHTFNPWIGCTKVSAACDHCYAEAWDKRFDRYGMPPDWCASKLAERWPGKQIVLARAVVDNWVRSRRERPSS